MGAESGIGLGVGSVVGVGVGTVSGVGLGVGSVRPGQEAGSELWVGPCSGLRLGPKGTAPACGAAAAAGGPGPGALRS